MLTILVAEFVRCPDTALASTAVDSINKTEALRLCSIGPVIGWIAQQSRGHARPQSEHNKGNQVAHGHCPASSFVQCRASRDNAVSNFSNHCWALSTGSKIKQSH